MSKLVIQPSFGAVTIITAMHLFLIFRVYSACASTFLKLDYMTNFDMLFLAMEFVSVVEETKSTLTNNCQFCIRSTSATELHLLVFTDFEQSGYFCLLLVYVNSSNWFFLTWCAVLFTYFLLTLTVQSGACGFTKALVLVSHSPVSNWT